MSCYIFGRDRAVADIPTDHPSCSKQHAVLQFRAVEESPSDIPGEPPRKVIKCVPFSLLPVPTTRY